MLKQDRGEDRPLFVAAVLALLAWGVLAFGANYPWACVPLMLAAATVGAAGLLRPASDARVPTAVAVGVAATIVAALAQVIPLSQSTLAAIAPSTDQLLRRYDLKYLNDAAAGTAVHSISVQPAQTVMSVCLFASFSLLMLGIARTLTRPALSRLTRGLIWLGVIVALLGVVQRPLFGRKIYGFWTPYSYSYPYGPFVNANHFAGWMLMTLSLAVGYLCGRARGFMRSVKPGWRNRVLWFSSADASKAILTAFAVVVMAISLVLTFSRSGIIGFAALVAIVATFVVRQRTIASRTVLTTAFLLIMVVAAVGWAGVDRLGARFSHRDVADLDGRIGAWSDAWHIAQRFKWTGTGLNTYGIATMFFQTADLSRHYDQAHNDYLQLAAEGGVLLCVPAAFTIVAVGVAIRRRLSQTVAGSSEYWIRVGAISGMVAVGVQEVADFSLQMPGNAALLCVLAGVALRSPLVHERNSVQHRH